MAESDSAFKMLFQMAPQDYVARFKPGAEFVRLETIELPRDPLRADALTRIRYPALRKEFIHHIETQLGADDQMAQRMCQYAIAVYLREGIEVLSTLIYLERCATPTSPWIMQGPDGAQLTFHFQIVRLWEESVDDWLGSHLTGIIPFVPLLKDATVEVIEPAVRQLAAIPNPGQRGNAINYLLFFASRAFDDALLEHYLEDHHMLEEQYIVESPWYQYILRKGTQRGVTQGVEQGIERGKEQGKAEGYHLAILALVARRFPALEAAVREQIQSIEDAAELDRIVVLAGTASDEAAFRQGFPLAPTQP